MFFCCGHPAEEPENQKPKAQSSASSKKQPSIASTFEIPGQKQNPFEFKKPQKPEPQYQLGRLQNNCQLIMFNARQGLDLLLSFAVKKTVVNVSRESKQNCSSVDTQIYQLLAKRSRDSTTLLLTEHADELLVRVYRKYQQAYVMVGVVAQPMHYVSKFTNRSKISGMHSGTFDEEVGDRSFDRGGFDKKRTFGGMTASGISQVSPVKETNTKPKEKERLPLDCILLSHPTQIKLNFFDEIYVYSPACKEPCMSASSKAWIQSVINNIHNLRNIQNLTMILPKQVSLNEVMSILQDLMQQKIKNQTLQAACNMIHFELECVYSDNAFSKVVIKKRFEQGDLTVMLLAINLLLIQFNPKSQQYYSSVLQHLKRTTFKQYMSMKSQMKQGHNSRRTLLKLLNEYKLMPEQMLVEFGTRFAQLKRIQDSWQNDDKYTMTVPRELRIQLSEFLSCRVFIPSCSYHVLSDNVPVEQQSDSDEGEEEIIVPSFKEDLMKEKVDDIHISLMNNHVEIDIEINQEEEEGGLMGKKPSVDDYEFQNARRGTNNRRKHSNDY